MSNIMPPLALLGCAGHVSAMLLFGTSAAGASTLPSAYALPAQPYGMPFATVADAQPVRPLTSVAGGGAGDGGSGEGGAGEGGAGDGGGGDGGAGDGGAGLGGNGLGGGGSGGGLGGGASGEVSALAGKYFVLMGPITPGAHAPVVMTPVQLTR